MFDAQKFFDSIYLPGQPPREILLRHSLNVAALAREINHRRNLGLDDAVIADAALLHDIGIKYTDAPGIGCHGTQPYLAHGAIGADLLRKAGAPEIDARVAERHTGSGLTAGEIASAGLPMPPGRSYMPHTLLEKLICYADCFYSKSGDGTRKSVKQVTDSFRKWGDTVVRRFLELHRLFSYDIAK